MPDQKVLKISHITYRLHFLSKERRDLTLAETHVLEQTSLLMQHWWSCYNCCTGIRIFHQGFKQKATLQTRIKHRLSTGQHQSQVTRSFLFPPQEQGLLYPWLQQGAAGPPAAGLSTPVPAEAAARASEGAAGPGSSAARAAEPRPRTTKGQRLLLPPKAGRWLSLPPTAASFLSSTRKNEGERHENSLEGLESSHVTQRAFERGEREPRWYNVRTEKHRNNNKTTPPSTRRGAAPSPELRPRRSG